MFTYLIRRAFGFLISLLVISAVVFILTEFMHGDVAQMVLGEHATPEALESLREQMGLYEPAHTRYFDWLSGVFRGDLGTSLSRGRVKIAPLLLSRIVNSAALAISSLAVIIPLSLGLGTLMGLKEDSLLDQIMSSLTLAAISLPEFISGIFLIVIFAVTLGVLPATSSIDPNVNPFYQIPHLVLPVITLSLVLLGYIARMVRATTIEVLKANYIRTAILKGLPRRIVIFRHVLKNSLLPSITVIAMQAAWLFGGLIVVEVVFAYPGVGRLTMHALNNRDVPMIQATVIFISACYLTANVIADILYGFLDPRIRYD